MTDPGAPPFTFDPKRYKLYRMDLILGQQEVRDDLEFLRLDEPGFTVGILPAGEKDVTKIVRFMIKHKQFCETGADGALIEPGHRDVAGLIRYMTQSPQPAAAAAQAAAKIEGSPGLMINKLSFMTSQTTGATEYRVIPKLIKAKPLTQPVDEKPKGAPFSIPDKYKIKPKDKSDS